MVKKLQKLILSLLVGASVLTGSMFIAHGEDSVVNQNSLWNEGYTLGNGLELSKEVNQYGNAVDRIYQVDLSVKGDIEVIQHEADVFILMNVSKLTFGEGKMSIAAYYLRSIWNVCDHLVTTYPNRTFNFRVIAVNDTSTPIIEKKFTCSNSNREQLGKIEELYVEKNGENRLDAKIDSKGNYTPVSYEDNKHTEDLTFHYNYDVFNEEKEIGQSLLGYLARMSKLALPGYMQRDDTGMTWNSTYLTDQSEYNFEKNWKFENQSADIELAFERMNDIIEKEGIKNAQAICMFDTLPSAHNNKVISTDKETMSPDKAEPYFKETYLEYEISRKKHNVLFHVFSNEEFASNSTENTVMWNEFIEGIGYNKLRNEQYWNDATQTDYKYNKEGWYSYRKEDDPAHLKYENLFKAKSSTIDDVKNVNEKLKDLAASVGNGLEIITDFATFTYLQDVVPSEFHVINGSGYEPKVVRKSDDGVETLISVGNSDSLIESVEILEQDGSSGELIPVETPEAKNRWNESGIRWNIKKLSANDGTYKFTFYIQANEDYFGGEKVLANKDAAIYYMTHDQWVAAGKPSNADGIDKSKFTKEDFIYKVENVNGKCQYVEDGNRNRVIKDTGVKIETYVPYFHKTQGGEVTIFYGDSADIMLADSYQDTVYVKGPDLTNTDLSPDVNYYFEPYATVKEQNGSIFDTQATWKNKNGNPLQFDWEWKSYSIFDKHTDSDGTKNGHFEEVFSRDISSLDKALLNMTATPDETMIYQLNYVESDDNFDPIAGVWQPINSNGEKAEFSKFESSEVKVRVNVEYGTINLTKVIQSNIKTDEELKEIDFVTGFPVKVTRDGAVFAIPTIRQGTENAAHLLKLKRGTYTLEEIVPQKFRFIKFHDWTRQKECTDKTYSFTVGFNNDEQSVKKENHVIVYNDFYTEKWFTSIHEADNMFKTSSDLDQKMIAKGVLYYYGKK